ncbi:hypothetical protein RJT34_05298 [Clitoria ternatea]|uniref:Uncharacterized protein n=1 Tax=Clitoria ternatea TaxID=43366 RepID=A0AAN9PR56_CLITE
MEKVLFQEKKHSQISATKSSSTPNVWDCGSTLYDSFELNSFKRQLDSAIASSPRTFSMPHLAERRVAVAERHQPSRKSFNISRSVQKLLRTVFKSSNKSTRFQVGEKLSRERNLYVVYDKSGTVLSTIPEGPEFEIGYDALSPEISSLLRRSASDRFTATPFGISCA